MRLECRRVLSPTPLNMRGIFSSFSFFSPFFACAGGVVDAPSEGIFSHQVNGVTSIGINYG